MKFLSVCSGIEAASVAWARLGWKAVGFAEIEPFPAAVLKHHYPDVINYGDINGLPDAIRMGLVELPDVLCGGTPCQAFSVAGLRASLDDARGNLSLVFCEIADAIDNERAAAGLGPGVVFWENVPGVLSTKDNAFGCFLGKLAGEKLPLEAPGGKWANAGAVLGPKRTVAWRTLDAQYFGVAQRRRRVFVVASARDGFDPATVLLEWDGVRRDSAPSREAGEAVAVCPTLRAGGNSTGGDRPPGTDVDTADSLQVVAFGGNNTAGPIDQAAALNANRGCHNPGDFEAGPLLVDQPYTLAIQGRGDSHNLEYRQDGTANALLTPNGGRGGIGVGAVAVVQPIGFIPKAPPNSRSMGEALDQSPTITTHQLGQGVATAMQVRRLTPVECERLQGFPDDYTAIPWRNKPASECPDGPRYKALGNSWAVPCVQWIGTRINEQMRGAA